jgi:dihydrofolate reductase
MNRLIIALDRKNGIAKHGYTPWYIPDDLIYFSKLTKTDGGIVLVGRTTYDVAFKGQPLKDRANYVLTSRNDDLKGAYQVSNLQNWLEQHTDQDVWIVGGANVYQQVMQSGKADELYVTKIDADFGCDQFFPDFEETHTLVEESEELEQNGFHFHYARYAKKS